MTVAALAPEVQRIWWITLGIGLVVAATTWLLGETAAALDQLKAEALRHDALLAAKATVLPDGARPPPRRKTP